MTPIEQKIEELLFLLRPKGPSGPTALADTTYETIGTITLSVSDMLTLSSSLYDAINWNEHKDWPTLANMVRTLQTRLEPQMRPLIRAADNSLKLAAKIEAARAEAINLDDYRD